VASTTFNASTAPTAGDGASTVTLLGRNWGRELRAITWVPVLTLPPKGAAAYLPWPIRVHTSPLAAPSQCVHLKDIHSCSSSNRICAIDVKNDIGTIRTNCFLKLLFILVSP
jgi:hypothetical protein